MDRLRLGRFEHVCATCSKVFLVTNNSSYVYRLKPTGETLEYCCSWKCYCMRRVALLRAKRSKLTNEEQNFLKQAEKLFQELSPQQNLF